MNTRLNVKLVTLSIVLFLTGCVTAPEIIKTADNDYTLTRIDRGGSFDEIANTRQLLIADANKFAASQNKVAVKIAMKETPLEMQGYTSVEYQFQLMGKAESDAMTAESAAKPAGNMSGTPAQSGYLAKSGALYDALIKLDELHKRGILTDEEFTSQKKKLLNN